MPSREILLTCIWFADKSLILAPTLSMKPEKNVLIVPLVAIKSTVVKRLLLMVEALRVDTCISSARIRLVLMFTGENVVTVNETMDGLVADRLVQEILSELTLVVVKVKLLHGGIPAMLVWNDI